MISSLVELAYVVVTISLGVVAAFALVMIPGVGYILGVIALGMIAIGVCALGVRRYVNSMKNKIADHHRGSM